MSTSKTARHQWQAGEIGTKEFLNALGGDLLFRGRLDTALAFNASPDLVFNNALALSSARTLMLICSGPVDIKDASAALRVQFAVTPPTFSPSAFEDAFYARGYQDAAGNPHNFEYKTAITEYVTSGATGNWSLCLMASDANASGHNPELSIGFRFYVIDCGAAF